MKRRISWRKFPSSILALALVAVTCEAKGQKLYQCTPTKVKPPSSNLIQITSPPDGTDVQQGQTLRVTFKADPSVSNLALIAGFAGGSVGQTSAANTFSLTVPPGTPIDQYEVSIAGTAGGKLTLSRPVSLVVDSSLSISSIQSEPGILLFDAAGDVLSLEILGTLSDGSTAYVTYSSQLSFTSSNRGVATVDSRGEVTAVGPGSAVITVALKGGAVTASVSVNVPEAPVPGPSLNPPAGSYSGTQTVAIRDRLPGTTIYYTTDGTLPTAQSTKYHAAISVTSNETINAIAMASGRPNSLVESAAYTIGALKIDSVVPDSAAIGALVEITGTAFGARKDNSSVRFNGVDSRVVSWSSTAIQAIVPPGATTGNVVVTVDRIASNGVPFDVLPTPRIVSLSQYAAPVGTTITITGNNFGSQQVQGDMASFSGANATPITWSDTNIIVQVPAGAVTGPMDVFAGGVSSNRIPFTVQPPVTLASIVTTVAGLTRGVYGNGSAATAAELASPNGVAVDTAGNLYIADGGNYQIRRVNAGTGIITAFAGTGQFNYSGDGQLGINAEVSFSGRMALDSAGNLYIADEDNNVIRQVSGATGVITTIAGNGTLGYSGDGGSALQAELSLPNGVAVDSVGNIYIADTVNDVIRKVTKSSGVISTVAGIPNSPGYGGDGGPGTKAQLSLPEDVAVDTKGNLYISDQSNSRIRLVTAATGIITTYAGNGNYGHTGDGGPAVSAEIGTPQGLSLDQAGNLYFADYTSDVVRKVTASTGVITTVAGNGKYGFSGDGGAAVAAELAWPRDVAVDAAGNLYVADGANNRIRKITVTGTISTVGGTGLVSLSDNGAPALTVPLYPTTPNSSSPATVAVDASGNIYFADVLNNMVREVSSSTGAISTVAGSGQPGYSGDGGPAVDAELNTPTGFVFDSQGNLYIADANNSVVRKVTKSTGVISTFAGNGVYGSSGDGGPATSAELTYPYGLAIDAAGNVYIADTFASAVRKVTPGGTISTVAGQPFQSGLSGDGGPATSAELGHPDALAIDSHGNLYIGDVINPVVREVNESTGIIETVIGNGQFGDTGDGGPALSASIRTVYGLSFDTPGSLYLADYARIRVVNSSGIIETVAGQYGVGYSGDGGQVALAQVSPTGIAIDSASNVYFPDNYGNRIRKISQALVQPATATPVLTPAGSYSSTASVTIIDSTPGAQIFYTLDGTVPNPGLSSLYTGPLSLLGTVKVSAIAVAPGHSTSATAAASYTLPATRSSTISFGVTTKQTYEAAPSNLRTTASVPFR